MVEANSPAARYIDHQIASAKAYRINGQKVSSDADDRTIEGDETTGKIQITWSDGSSTYTWKRFKFDQAGKITAWTGTSGPLRSVLWTRESTDSAVGVSARLVSAYRMNAGPMLIVVEFSTTRDVELSYSASYAANNGNPQKPSEQSSRTGLDKGEKKLSYYSFDHARFRGMLRLKAAARNGYRTADLKLAIR